MSASRNSSRCGENVRACVFWTVMLESLVHSYLLHAGCRAIGAPPLCFSPNCMSRGLLIELQGQRIQSTYTIVAILTSEQHGWYLPVQKIFSCVIYTSQRYVLTMTTTQHLRYRRITRCSIDTGDDEARLLSRVIFFLKFQGQSSLYTRNSSLVLSLEGNDPRRVPKHT